MQLIICRHGETDFNAQKRLQGWMETSINERGRKQAGLLGERLKNEHFDYAFSSTLKRTRQTFGEVMKHHKDTPMQYRPELREVDLGIYDGMNREEIDQNYPGHWAERVDNKYGFRHRAGESYKSVDEGRVKSLLQEFREKYSSRTILIMTHQGTAKLMLGSMLGLKPEEKMHIIMPNDCIYFVDYLPNKTAVRYELLETGEKGTGIIRQQ